MSTDSAAGPMRRDADGQLDPFRRLAWPIWATLLLTIPFTSHPWVAAATGRTGVSPLAGIPMALLVVSWLPVYFWKKRTAPRSVFILGACLTAAALSSSLAFFLPAFLPAGSNMLGREVRALSTLVAGIGFFALAATLPRTESDLKATLRWLYIGALVLLAYSTFEILRISDVDNPVPQNIVDLHRLFSIRDPERARVSGFAYEPSWLGNQLVMLYLPVLLASVCCGLRVFSIRRRGLPLEWLFLPWVLVVLFFAFARLAWVSGLLMVLVSIWAAYRRARRRSGPRREAARGPGRLPGWLVRAAQVLGALFVFALIAGALFAVGATIDPRLEALFEIDFQSLVSGRHPWPYRLASELRYAERMMYWVAGFRIFSLVPLFGVGLGNAAFWLASTVPSYAFYLPETIRSIHLGAFGLPNTKSLWVRILAETGIVGFSVFLMWIVEVAARAARLVRGASALGSTLGLAGLLTLLALAVEGFSLDTFALPQLWIIPGLVVAAARLGESAGRPNRPDPGVFGD